MRQEPGAVAMGSSDSFAHLFNGWCSLKLTLKALANSSPGFALKPWDKMRLCSVATLKELRGVCVSPDGDATLTGLRLQFNEAHYPGLPSATLGWN